MDEVRRQQREEQTGDVYRAIGEFVTSFEMVCDSLQTGIMFLLHKAGLENQRIAHVILAGMTAEPLTSLYAAIVAESQNYPEDERKLIDGALARFRKLTQLRNDIIHATWFVGWGNDETIDWSVADTMKYHKNKKGAVYKNSQYSPDDIHVHIQEAKDLADVFRRLMGCFLGDRSIKKDFDIDSDGNLRVPSQT